MRSLVVAVLLGGVALTASCALTGRGSRDAGTSTTLVGFADPQSMARLDRSDHKVDFFRLAGQFESQSNKIFCGPTTAVIVLNTLRSGSARIEKPEDPTLLPPELRSALPAGFDPLYHRYTQNDLFDAKTDVVKTRAEIFGRPHAPGAKPDPGLQLRQLHGVLRARGLDSQLRVANDELSDQTIHRELVENLATPDDYVIVNYLRSALGQEGGGHISPLGAYDQESDSFLILDVNPNGHTWVWAPAAALIRAMRTFDTVENRGYLLVREGSH